MSPDFPASLRLAVFGVGDGPDVLRARFPGVPDAAWVRLTAPSAIEALREFAHGDRDHEVLLLDAAAVLPPLFVERMLRFARACAADVICPLGNADPALSPLPHGVRHDTFDPVAVDRGVALYGTRNLLASNRWLPSAGLWRRRALNWLLDHPQWSGGQLPDVIEAALCDHLFVARADLPLCGPDPDLNVRHPAPGSPLDIVRARFRAVGGSAPALPGADGRSVVLHILHGWGGGVQRWVHDMAAADPDRCHLALLAEGHTSRRRYGESLSLQFPAQPGTPLRHWPLARPIAATALAHAEYQTLLSTVLREFCVDAVIVSSLIGHSLDALRTGLPTIVVCHDRYPAWPLLHDRFEDPDRRWDDAELEQSLARDRDSPFADRNLGNWREIRNAWLSALQDGNASLVAPGEALRQSLLRIEPRLQHRSWQIVPHGIASFDAPAAAWKPSAGNRLRVLVLGRINAAKGVELLSQVVPELGATMDFHLLGCGSAGEALFGVAGVHIELDYERDQLPALLARIAPDIALLPSTVAETFSYTLSELWALGVPVLACRIGSFAERISHGSDGWLVEANADAVIGGLRKLAHDPGLCERLRLGVAARSVRGLDAMVRDYAGLLPPAQVPARHAPGAIAVAELAHAQAALESQQLRHQVAHDQKLIRGQQEDLERRAQWAQRYEKLAAQRTQWAKSLQEQLGADTARFHAEIAAQRDAYEASRQELLDSTSWRVTAPLRWVMLRVRRLRTNAEFRLRQIRGLVSRSVLSLRQRGVMGTLRRTQEWLSPPRRSLVAPAVPALNQPFAPFALPRSDAPRVSIVIPVFNHFDHTLTCLRSIAANPGSLSFEVIVVDDCSSDQTAQRLPQIEGLRAVRNAQNLGFIGACNAGAAQARGEFVLFLNNDTAVMPGWIDALVDTFRLRPDAGLVGAKLVYPDGRLQEAGGIVFSDGSGWNYGRLGDPADCAYAYLREVDYCSGAAIILRRALFDRLGGFDSHYAPAYYEDTDLAFKIRAAGLKVYYQPASVVVHFEGVTSGTDTANGAKRFQVINQAKFVERWEAALAQQPKPGTPISIAREHRVRGRVLMIDACVPTPDQDSGSVRVVNLMRVLIELGWKVSFVAENRLALPGYTEPLQQLGVQMLHAPDFSSAPDWFRKHGAELDAVIVSRHYVASTFVPLIREYARRARLIFDTVDLHYLREQRAADLSGSHADLARVRATRQAELNLVRACDVTVVVSPVEKQLLEHEVPGSRIEVLSNVHEVVGLRVPLQQRRDIWFVGGFQHTPNIDAVQWFVRDVWPLIAGRLPQLQLHIVGSRMPAAIHELAQDRIQVHGHVENLDRFLDGCRLSIAPLRYGAGVKGKVNMAMAHGQPVVATSMAVEGMHVSDGVEVLVADQPATFADAVVRACTDDSLWQLLSAAGLANVQRHFSFAAASEAAQRILPPR